MNYIFLSKILSCIKKHTLWTIFHFYFVKIWIYFYHLFQTRNNLLTPPPPPKTTFRPPAFRNFSFRNFSFQNLKRKKEKESNKKGGAQFHFAFIPYMERPAITTISTKPNLPLGIIPPPQLAISTLVKTYMKLISNQRINVQSVSV